MCALRMPVFIMMVTNGCIILFQKQCLVMMIAMILRVSMLATCLHGHGHEIWKTSSADMEGIQNVFTLKFRSLYYGTVGQHFEPDLICV